MTENGSVVPPAASTPKDAPTPVTTAPDTLATATSAEAVTRPGRSPSSKAEVARWVVSWSEPLLSTEARVTIDAEMARFVNRNSDWACTWMAGVLTDLIQSLPADDPWRNLTGLVDLDQITTGKPTTDPDKRLARKGPAPYPATTGAIRPDGTPFGTLRDSSDLLWPDLPDPTTDIGLAAVAVDLSPLGGALVALSNFDPKVVQFALVKIHHHLWLAQFAGLIEGSAGEALVGSVGQAIRWIVHRRRCYTGIEDPYPTTVGFAWIAKSDRVMAGADILTERGMAGQGAIEESAYRDLTG